MTRTIFSLCVALFLTISLSAQDAATVDQRDSLFLVRATQHSLAMVRCAEIAIARGLIGDDLDFAVMLVSDHTRLLQTMQELGGKLDLNLPIIPDLDHQNAIDNLGALPDENIRPAFLKIVMDDQEHAVDDYTTMTTEAIDPQVTAFAIKNLPTLQTERTYAKKLRVKQ